ncbi:hypothetical protein BYZ73_10055 [Rhodovulum viride]|uniref:STAS domain-containing protein n=1 Tax=Rhodovulum viride TaxID=1231134 RepID=A0ABX9DHJ7_9RHOB|nr:hypothetical protein BYZ73_10055 [Rhodovulum viride]
MVAATLMRRRGGQRRIVANAETLGMLRRVSFAHLLPVDPDRPRALARLHDVALAVPATAPAARPRPVLGPVRRTAVPK